MSIAVVDQAELKTKWKIAQLLLKILTTSSSVGSSSRLEENSRGSHLVILDSYTVAADVRYGRVE
jgi:hypothetical protein